MRSRKRIPHRCPLLFRGLKILRILKLSPHLCSHRILPSSLIKRALHVGLAVHPPTALCLSVCSSACLISEHAALFLPTFETPNQSLRGCELMISLHDWLWHWSDWSLCRIKPHSASEPDFRVLLTVDAGIIAIPFYNCSRKMTVWMCRKDDPPHLELRRGEKCPSVRPRGRVTKVVNPKSKIQNTEEIRRFEDVRRSP